MKTTERNLRRVIRNVVSEVSDHRESRPRQDFGKPTSRHEEMIVRGTKASMAEYLTHELEDELPGEDLFENEKIQKIIYQAIEEKADAFYGEVLELVMSRV